MGLRREGNTMSNKPIHSHDSHGFGPVRTGHEHSDIARDGAPKRVHSIAVHDGMSKRTKTGAVALGGNHASAIDALSGATVVPGAVTAQAGYGNSGIQSGHPFAKPPGSKRLTPVRAAFGMKDEGGNVPNLEELGRAVLAEAVKN
jgi:hypothetical protein